MRLSAAALVLLLNAETSVCAFAPHGPFMATSAVGTFTLHPRLGTRPSLPPRGYRPRSLAMTSAGGTGGSGAVPPPETDAEKREIENLRRVAAQAQLQPNREQEATRLKAQALRQEFETKAGLREIIADKAKELLSKAAADPRLASAVSDSAAEAVLTKVIYLLNQKATNRNIYIYFILEDVVRYY